MTTLTLVKQVEQLRDQVSTGIPNKTMVLNANLEDLFDIPHHPLQRNEELRINKMSPIFARGCATLYDFAVINVTEEFTMVLGKEDSLLIEPGLYMCDGHTRRLWFKMNPEQMPAHAVVVSIYNVDNAKDFEEIYYSFDSADSVETSGNKLTGIFRANGIKDKVTSPVLIRGGIKSAIEMAYPGDPKERLSDKVYYFKDEIVMLDHLGVFSTADPSLRFQTLYAACLITAKMYAGDSEDIINDRLHMFLLIFYCLL